MNKSVENCPVFVELSISCGDDEDDTCPEGNNNYFTLSRTDERSWQIDFDNVTEKFLGQNSITVVAQDKINGLQSESATLNVEIVDSCATQSVIITPALND